MPKLVSDEEYWFLFPYKANNWNLAEQRWRQFSTFAFIYKIKFIKLY